MDDPWGEMLNDLEKGAPWKEANVLLVAGSRDLHPSTHMLSNASYIFDVTFTGIISGGARGVDTEARKWAEDRGYDFREYPAEWDKYGKRAGYLRNQVMVNACTHAIIVWDGLSFGTSYTIELLDKHHKPYVLLRNI